MNEYLTYIAIGVGVLLISLLIPGLKVIAEAIFKLLVEALTGLFVHKGQFMIYVIKTLWADHTRVFQHACQSRDTIDPTQRIRETVGTGD